MEHEQRCTLLADVRSCLNEALALRIIKHAASLQAALQEVSQLQATTTLV